MIMNVLGELAIFGYFIYLTIKPEPALQVHYKIIIIMMIIIFIITYLLSIVDVVYNALWYCYRQRKNKILTSEED